MRTQFSRGTIVAKRSDLALKGPGACLQATGPLPLLTLHRRALRNEYVTGESVCGGAVVSQYQIPGSTTHGCRVRYCVHASRPKAPARSQPSGQAVDRHHLRRRRGHSERSEEGWTGQAARGRPQRRQSPRSEFVPGRASRHRPDCGPSSLAKELARLLVPVRRVSQPLDVRLQIEFDLDRLLLRVRPVPVVATSITPR